MPIYQYQCQQCGEVSEFLLRSSVEGEAPACPSCGSRNLKKLISAPALLRNKPGNPGTTCCGRTERCETSPCSSNEPCRRA